ncbi:MAG TPA: hypothetical protein VFU21_31070 [Kofleriaceae bacterium]|nr:hypothetical protein [Kofleriaceae bacterium]
MPRRADYIGALVLLLTGCVAADIGEADEPGLVEIEFAADNGIFLDNGLNLPNGMNLGNGTALSNGMNLGNGVDLANGMNLGNGLNLGNGITGPYYAPPAGSGLEQWIDVDPPARKKVLRYLVECALPAGVEVQLLHRGSLELLGRGIAGLGPSLQSGPMSPIDQQRVTACMLARVNGTGQTVQIAMFGRMGDGGEEFERVTTSDGPYPVPESAFFGNLFAATPQAYACQAVNYPLAEARSCRDLGGGAYDCGVLEFSGWDCSAAQEHYVQCEVVWTSDFSRVYYADCVGGNVRWPYVLATFIAPKADGELCAADADCASGECGNGVCGGAGAPAGTRCYQDAECASNLCSPKKKVCL